MEKKKNKLNLQRDLVYPVRKRATREHKLWHVFDVHASNDLGRCRNKTFAPVTHNYYNSTSMSDDGSATSVGNDQRTLLCLCLGRTVRIKPAVRGP